MEHHRIVREQLMANKNKRAQELAELVAAEKRDLESKERMYDKFFNLIFFFDN